MNIMIVVYALMCLASLLAIGIYKYSFKKQQSRNGLLAFGAIFVIVFGYFILAISNCLTMALLANDLAYAGTIALLVIMFININDFCELKLNKVLIALVIAISFLAFLLVASGGTSIKLYYASVTLTKVNNISVLVKEYGPLHNAYAIYVVLLFILMIGVVAYSLINKKTKVIINPLVLIFLVTENIFIWFIEKFVAIDFELLAISYVITEYMFLLLFKNADDYQKLNELINIKKEIKASKNVNSVLESWITEYALTEREVEVLKLLIENMPRSDIAKTLFISEHTVKKHTTHIYEKLCVTSRNDLLYKLNEEISG